MRSGNADELREELGDVLLQVLFHARIAEDAPQHPFTIDDVADSLVRKLGNRVPAVLAGESISLDEQLAQWEERKAAREASEGVRSSMDDVPTGQPALALAQKVIERVTAAGLPADLIPDGMHVGDGVGRCRTPKTLCAQRFWSSWTPCARSSSAIAADRRGEDVPEELDVATLGVITEEEWRAYWPPAAEDTEPGPDRIPEPTPADVPEPAPVDVPEPGPVEVPEPSPVDVPEPSPEDVAEPAEKFTA